MSTSHPLIVYTMKASFKQDKWYTLPLEIVGNQAWATRNGVRVYGINEWSGFSGNIIYLEQEHPHMDSGISGYMKRNPTRNGKILSGKKFSVK